MNRILIRRNDKLETLVSTIILPDDLSLEQSVTITARLNCALAEIGLFGVKKHSCYAKLISED